MTMTAYVLITMIESRAPRDMVSGSDYHHQFSFDPCCLLSTELASFVCSLTSSRLAILLDHIHPLSPEK